MCGPKSTSSWYAGLRAPGNGRAATIRPTRTSTLRKSAKLIGLVSVIAARIEAEPFVSAVRYHKAEGGVYCCSVWHCGVGRTLEPGRVAHRLGPERRPTQSPRPTPRTERTADSANETGRWRRDAPAHSPNLSRVPVPARAPAPRA